MGAVAGLLHLGTVAGGLLPAALPELEVSDTAEERYRVEREEAGQLPARRLVRRATSQDYENARCDQRDRRGILKAHKSRRTTCEPVRQVRPAAGAGSRVQGWPPVRDG